MQCENIANLRLEIDKIHNFLLAYSPLGHEKIRAGLTLENIFCFIFYF